jgi:hypothetical protein
MATCHAESPKLTLISGLSRTSGGARRSPAWRIGCASTGRSVRCGRQRAKSGIPTLDVNWTMRQGLEMPMSEKTTAPINKGWTGTLDRRTLLQRSFAGGHSVDGDLAAGQPVHVSGPLRRTPRPFGGDPGNVTRADEAGLMVCSERAEPQAQLSGRSGVSVASMRGWCESRGTENYAEASRLFNADQFYDCSRWLLGQHQRLPIHSEFILVA